MCGRVKNDVIMPDVIKTIDDAIDKTLELDSFLNH
jgi:hypothetical protein